MSLGRFLFLLFVFRSASAFWPFSENSETENGKSFNFISQLPPFHRIYFQFPDRYVPIHNGIKFNQPISTDAIVYGSKRLDDLADQDLAMLAEKENDGWLFFFSVFLLGAFTIYNSRFNETLTW